MAALAAAQGTPALLADLNTGSSGPGSSLRASAGGVQLGGRLLMAGADAVHGSELWSTDGNAAGTTLVLDLAPGPRSSTPEFLTVMGGFVYFAADDAARGKELWRTDGTATGTTLVKDIAPGFASGAPANLAVVSGVLYFSADDGVVGRELWKSDGTTAGTVLVDDIRPGSADGILSGGNIVPGRHVIAGVPFSVALFMADDGVSGRELWESRGTAATTQRRADINPGAGHSAPAYLTAFSGHVMFAADDGVTGVEPYYIRDSAPVQIADLNTGAASSNPREFTPIGLGGGPRYFFAATNATYGREVFFWDTGVSAGDLLHDINPGVASADPELLAVGGMVLIAATSATLGRELWRTNASLTAATLVRNFQAGSAGSSVALEGVITSSPARALIRADDGVTGMEAWVTDGTAAGTVLLMDTTTSSTPTLIGPFGSGQVLFSKTIDGAERPLVTDGTPAGTFFLPSDPGSTLPSDPSGLAVLGFPQRGLFAAEHRAAGRELWITDGTSAGTSLLKDIAPRGPSSSPQGFLVAGALCYFTADDGTSGREPWVSDGTAAGTRLLRDVNPGSAGSSLMNFVAAGGIVYFGANDGTHGFELWRTDGTTAGTTMVVDLDPGSGNGVFNNQPLAPVGSRVMFWSDVNAAAGNEPWTSTGTAAGTALLKDIEPGSGGSLFLSSTECVEFGGYTYFSPQTTATGKELWRTNGTGAGTTLVMDLIAGAGSALPHAFVPWGGALYFLASGTSSNTVLWSTFGTTATTAQVRSFARPPGGFLQGDGITALTATDSALVFAAWDSAHGFEPWTSNGTFGGTVLLADTMPGPVSGLPIIDDVVAGLRTEAWFFTLPGADRVLFPAHSGTDGIELWRTDLSTAGTVRHAELRSGPAGVRPGRPTRVGTRLVFTAADAVVGVEPFAMDAMAFSEPFGVGCAGSNGRTPAIAGSDAPAIGNGAYGVQVSSARGSTTTILMVGFGPLDVAIGGGCRLYLDLAIPPITLVGATNPVGLGVTSLPIPADQSLMGLQLWAQVDVVDPGAAFQNLLAITGGLHIVVGPN